MKKNLLFLIFLFFGFQLINASTTRYYGQCTFFNGVPSPGTLFKYVDVVFYMGKASTIKRGGQSWGLYYQGKDGDFNNYTSSNSNFQFAINAETVVEYYFFNGVLNTVTVYSSKSNSSNNTYNGDEFYGGGNYNNGNSSSTYSTCRTCGGSGVCTSCHGSGGEWRDTGYYTGSGSRTWISCPSCNGSKRCFNCHGTGRY